MPSGVTRVHAVVDGGSGADGQGSDGGGQGAPGGQVTADLTVTPGEVLTLWVGGAGQPGGGAGYGNPTHDKFGGGAGGSSYGPGTGSAGGGGAASYIMANGSVLAVAGGGGGGGGAGSPVVLGDSAGGGASGGGYFPAQDEYPGWGNALGETNAAASPPTPAMRRTPPARQHRRHCPGRRTGSTDRGQRDRRRRRRHRCVHAPGR